MPLANIYVQRNFGSERKNVLKTRDTKNQKPIHLVNQIREAVPDDAADVLELFQRVRTESFYLLLEQDEGIQDVLGQKNQLEVMQQKRHQTIFLAFDNKRAIGFVGISRGVFKRNQHTANIAVAVESAYQRRGVGFKLIQAVLQWAKREAVVRVELTVAIENEAAISLYKAHGFIIEGTKNKSFRIKDRFVDEYIMAYIF